jgi:hypothetical protein
LIQKGWFLARQIEAENQPFPYQFQDGDELLGKPRRGTNLFLINSKVEMNSLTLYFQFQFRSHVPFQAGNETYKGTLKTIR